MVKSKTAEIIYTRMLETDAEQVGKAALLMMNSVQSDKVANQILGVASLLICLLHQYDLNHIDVLGLADNMVYSAENNNMTNNFKALRDYMKNEWEI